MTTAASNGYDLEQGVYAGIPSLVGKAMGPARQWFSSALEWVCGDPQQLRSTGEQYLQLGREVSTVSMDLGELVAAVPTWQGPAATAYRTTMAETVELVDKVGGFVGRTNEILVAAAEVAVEAANLIWDIVVELVTWLVATLMKAMAASTFSLGASIAAWLASAIGQVCAVVTKVAQVVGRVGTLLMKVVTLLQKLAAVITKYKVMLDRIQQLLSRAKEAAGRLDQLSDRAGAVTGSGTWDDHKRTGGTSAYLTGGTGPGTAIDAGSGSTPSVVSRPVGVAPPGATYPGADGQPGSGRTATPDWEYGGGYRPVGGDGSTAAAGAADPGAGPDMGGRHGSGPTVGGRLPADVTGTGRFDTGSSGGGVAAANWEYGGGRRGGTGRTEAGGFAGHNDPVSSGTGSDRPGIGGVTGADLAGSGQPSPSAGDVTRAAGLTGGVSAGPSSAAPGGTGPVGTGAPDLPAAGGAARGAGLSGGVGAMPGHAPAAVPVAPAGGGAGRGSVAGPVGPMAVPLGSGSTKDKDNPRTEGGRGPLEDVRIGEDEDAASPAAGTPDGSRP